MDLTVDCMEALHTKLKMLSFQLDESKLQYFHIDLIPDKTEPGTGTYITRTNAYNQCEEVVTGIRSVIEQMDKEIAINTGDFERLVKLLRQLCTSTDVHQLALYLKSHPLSPKVSESVWEQIQEYLPRKTVLLLLFLGFIGGGAAAYYTQRDLSDPPQDAGNATSAAGDNSSFPAAVDNVSLHNASLPSAADNASFTANATFRGPPPGSGGKFGPRFDHSRIPAKSFGNERFDLLRPSFVQAKEKLSKESDQFLKEVQNAFPDNSSQVTPLYSVAEDAVHFVLPKLQPFAQFISTSILMQPPAEIPKNVSANITAENQTEWAEAVVNVTIGCFEISSNTNLCLQFKASFDTNSRQQLIAPRRVLFDSVYKEIKELRTQTGTLHIDQFSKRGCDILHRLAERYQSTENSAALVSVQETVASSSVGEALMQASTKLANVLASAFSENPPVTKQEELQNLMFFNQTFSAFLPEKQMDDLLGQHATDLQKVSDQLKKVEMEVYRGNDAYVMKLLYSLTGPYVDKLASYVLPAGFFGFRKNSPMAHFTDMLALELEKVKVAMNQATVKEMQIKQTRRIGDSIANGYLFLVDAFRNLVKNSESAIGSKNQHLVDEYCKIAMQYLRASFNERMSALTKLTTVEYVSSHDMFSGNPESFYVDADMTVDQKTLEFVQQSLRPYIKQQKFVLRRADYSELSGSVQASIMDVLSGESWWKELIQVAGLEFGKHQLRTKLLENFDLLPVTAFSWRICDVEMKDTGDFDFSKVEIIKKAVTAVAAK